MTFAKCEDYINIRTEPSKKGEITAKIYNHDSAVIVLRRTAGMRFSPVMPTAM